MSDVLYFERRVAAMVSNNHASSNEVVSLLAETTNITLMKIQDLKGLRHSDLDVAQQRITALEWNISRLEALVPKLQEALERATKREREQLKPEINYDHCRSAIENR